MTDCAEIVDPERDVIRPEALRNALSVGHLICERAIWRKNHCNWPSAARGPNHDRKVSVGLESVRVGLGTDLYSGTAGVALFLGRLAQVSGDEQLLRTCLGAIRHGISFYERLRAVAPLSFFSGALGVGFAATCIAELLHQSELAEEADAIIDAAVIDIERQLNAPSAVAFDVIHGHAGAIPCLLFLANTCSRDSLLPLAFRLGDDLLTGAIDSGPGCGWPAPPSRMNMQSRPMIGFSHGTAGIASALFELHRQTGREETTYRAVARRALAYEDSLFDHQVGNWPDLRVQPPAPERFPVAWCHGAPGIVLARAVAARADCRYRGDYFARQCRTLDALMLSAFKTTCERLPDMCICHGLSGLMMISELVNTRQRTSCVGRYRRDFLDMTTTWLETPDVRDRGCVSLMLGWAGVGEALLQIAAPSRFSALTFLL
jgi:lantibiotic biosynthesis protein